jgi:hypothetical protein
MKVLKKEKIIFYGNMVESKENYNLKKCLNYFWKKKIISMKTKILLIRNYQKEISKIMKKDFPIMIL